MEFDPGRWFKKTKGDPELNDLILKFIQYNFTNQYVGLKSLPAMQEIWVQSQAPLYGCYGCHGIMVIVRCVLLARLWAGRKAQRGHLGQRGRL